MSIKLRCPNCQRKFRVEPGIENFAECPGCTSRVPIPVEALVEPSTGEPRRGRGGLWVFIIAGAFALVWVFVIVAIVMKQAKQSGIGAGTPAATPTTPAPVKPSVTSTPRTTGAPDVDNRPVTPTFMPPKTDPSTQPTTGPATQPVPELRIVPKEVVLTDAEIVASIRKGVTFLLEQFDGPELRKGFSPNSVEQDGLNALAIYALLHCSQSTRDERISIGSPFMKSAMEKMKSHPMNAIDVIRSPVTYARSLRASALGVFSRTQDISALRNDVQWLVNASYNGAFGYDDYFRRPGQQLEPRSVGRDPMDFEWDNSNSQYGLIGVWNAAEGGAAVPAKFWKDVEDHWTNCQLEGGLWSYKGDDRGSWPMSVAGVMALSVARDYQELGADAKDVGRAPYSAALKKAIAWLESGDTCVQVGGAHWSYSLYGLERAALASGLQYCGTHDIYRELAPEVVKQQKSGGSFVAQEGREAVIDTAFCLLFLARGRNPVMMNKLRYDGDWNNRPRDLANLTRYATYAMERPVNWQIVNLTHNWVQWMDAPILYIAGSRELPFTDADVDKLRLYIENGGLLFTHADNGSKVFSESVEKLAQRLFPSYEMQDVPAGDDLYSIQFAIQDPKPRFRSLSNGSRRLMLHSLDEFTSSWQARDVRRRKGPFEIGINLFLYATGKTEPRTRTDSPYIKPPPGDPARTIPVARVRYSGNWNPEPAAWNRFSRYFWWETGWALTVTSVPATDLRRDAYPVAVLTGTAPDAPTDAEAAAIRAYVSEGGTLLIDACGGSRLFQESIRKNWLPKVFAGSVPRVLSEDDPILTGNIPGMKQGAAELGKPQLRPFSTQVARPTNLAPMEIRLGSGRVIISELDLTTGLLGTGAWGVNGYSPAYAQALLKNMVLGSIR